MRDYQQAALAEVNAAISTNDSPGIAADLVAKIKASGPLPTIAALPGLFHKMRSTNSKYPGNKAQREAVVRGLAGGVRPALGISLLMWSHSAENTARVLRA